MKVNKYPKLIYNSKSNIKLNKEINILEIDYYDNIKSNILNKLNIYFEELSIDNFNKNYKKNITLNISIYNLFYQFNKYINNVDIFIKKLLTEINKISELHLLNNIVILNNNSLILNDNNSKTVLKFIGTCVNFFNNIDNYYKNIETYLINSYSNNISFKKDIFEIISNKDNLLLEKLKFKNYRNYVDMIYNFIAKNINKSIYNIEENNPELRLVLYNCIDFIKSKRNDLYKKFLEENIFKEKLDLIKFIDIKSKCCINIKEYNLTVENNLKFVLNHIDNILFYYKLNFNKQYFNKVSKIINKVFFDSYIINRNILKLIINKLIKNSFNFKIQELNCKGVGNILNTQILSLIINDIINENNELYSKLFCIFDNMVLDYNNKKKNYVTLNNLLKKEFIFNLDNLIILTSSNNKTNIDYNIIFKEIIYFYNTLKNISKWFFNQDTNFESLIYESINDIFAYYYSNKALKKVDYNRINIYIGNIYDEFLINLKNNSISILDLSKNCCYKLNSKNNEENWHFFVKNIYLDNVNAFLENMLAMITNLKEFSSFVLEKLFIKRIINDNIMLYNELYLIDLLQYKLGRNFLFNLRKIADEYSLSLNYCKSLSINLDCQLQNNLYPNITILSNHLVYKYIKICKENDNVINNYYVFQNIKVNNYDELIKLEKNNCLKNCCLNNDLNNLKYINEFVNTYTNKNKLRNIYISQTLSLCQLDISFLKFKCTKLTIVSNMIINSLLLFIKSIKEIDFTSICNYFKIDECNIHYIRSYLNYLFKNKLINIKDNNNDGNNNCVKHISTLYSLNIDYINSIIVNNKSNKDIRLNLNYNHYIEYTSEINNNKINNYSIVEKRILQSKDHYVIDCLITKTVKNNKSKSIIINNLIEIITNKICELNYSGVEYYSILNRINSLVDRNIIYKTIEETNTYISYT